MTQLQVTLRPTGPGEFDITGALPNGTTVLEASAGTGKTHTIAALAARYLAEGVPLAHLMIVTFSRAASQELRARVRSRLSEVERLLSRRLEAPSEPLNGDDVDELLLAGTPADVSTRLNRVREALADFDAATIATTHEFCRRMLDGLGMLSDNEGQLNLVEDISDLVHQAAGDLYLERFASQPERPPFSLVSARAIAQAAVASPLSELVPTGASEAADKRVAFGEAVRREVDRRKRTLGIITFDDMLTRLHEALSDDVTGELACNRLADRFRVVLIDEFQDTDPLQWQIVERAFHGRSTLVLIGDPKQAIYAFRGADVYSYLDAARQAHRQQTLSTNHRADKPVVDALHALFDGAALGEPQIAVRPIRATHTARLRTAPGTGWASPVRVRTVDADPPLTAPDARERVTADVVTDIARLLSSDTTVLMSPSLAAEPIAAHHVAVLVSTNRRGEQLRTALAGAGIPAVFSGSSSVFETATADAWLTFLRALDQPRPSAVRLAALTPLIGWTFTTLVEASDDEVARLTHQVRDWSRILRRHGIAAVFEAVSTQTGLAERILAQAQGQRVLTDVRHLAQALHAASTEQQLGSAALVDWLADRTRRAKFAGGDDRLRRLETDAAAVQIMTIHRSKGLQFPIVYLPDVWDRHVRDEEDNPLTFHVTDESGAVRRQVDVGGRFVPGRSRRVLRHRQEEAGDSLRSLYVAATRAQCHVTLWWAPTKASTAASPLQRVLSARRSEDGVPDLEAASLTHPAHVHRLAAAGVLVEPAGAVGARPLLRPADPTGEPLSARHFRRSIDRDWRRTSYSGLTAAAHEAHLAMFETSASSEGIERADPDERHRDESDPAPAGFDEADAGEAGFPTAAAGVVSPTTPDASLGVCGETLTLDDPLAASTLLAGFPAGPAFGTLVHAVLEQADTTAPDVEAELSASVAPLLERIPMAGVSADELAAALAPVVHTPLGPLLEGARLADISRRDRLSELTFEYPLGSSLGETTLAGVADLLDAHLPVDDILAGYANSLRDPHLDARPLRGFLTGSIDAVVRTSTDRFVIVDYKTNRLAPPDEPLRLRHYTTPALAAAMTDAHYPLQALVYEVALHRFLRWRLPTYDPRTHLGGVLYLFVRGMAGAVDPADARAGCGVFSWRPPPSSIVALSDLIARGGAV